MKTLRVLCLGCFMSFLPAKLLAFSPSGVSDLAVRNDHDVAREEYQQGLDILISSLENPEKSTAEAVDLIQRAASRKYPRAEFKLAVMYLRGLGVDQNEEMARHWMERSARHGYPFAQHMLRHLDQAGVAS